MSDSIRKKALDLTRLLADSEDLGDVCDTATEFLESERQEARYQIIELESRYKAVMEAAKTVLFNTGHWKNSPFAFPFAFPSAGKCILCRLQKAVLLLRSADSEARKYTEKK